LKLKFAFLALALMALSAVGPLSASPIVALDTILQPGNQTFGGSLGLDFDVFTPITVTALGVFDSNGDGIVGAQQVAIYDRNSQTIVIPYMVFTGSGDTLINGNRMRNLDVPVVLAVGNYSVVADGFSAGDPNGNSSCVGNPAPSCLPDNPFTLSTENSNGGAIQFVGGARYDASAGVYPLTIDAGPENRYLAGTFAFDVPEPSTLALLAAGLLGVYSMRRRAVHRS
jgi:hypothetical protein